MFYNLGARSALFAVHLAQFRLGHIFGLALWVKFSADDILKYYMASPSPPPHLWEGGQVDFGADPIGLGMTLSCLHNIL